MTEKRFDFISIDYAQVIVVLLRLHSSLCLVILFICVFSFTRDHNENKVLAICLMPSLPLYFEMYRFNVCSTITIFLCIRIFYSMLPCTFFVTNKYLLAMEFGRQSWFYLIKNFCRISQKFEKLLLRFPICSSAEASSDINS